MDRALRVNLSAPAHVVTGGDDARTALELWAEVAMAGEARPDVRGADRDCRQAEELLGLLVLDRTTSGERDWADRHLACCARCRAAHDYIAVVPQYLRLLTSEDVAQLLREAAGEVSVDEAG